jgi:hypothetical protein
MRASLPLSTLKLLLAPASFDSEPDRVISWARELLNAGYSNEAIFDLVVTDPSEWQRAARLAPLVVRSVGIDLANDDQLRRMAISLISNHLQTGGTGRELLGALQDFWYFEGGWREEIGSLFRNLWYVAEDTLSGFMWGVPDGFDRPHLTGWVTAHWRDFLTKQGWLGSR